MRSPTHYEVLGVTPAASLDDIRRAYRDAARRHHPDARAATPAGGQDPDPGPGEVSMAAINAAWYVLRDPVRRRAYDREIGEAPAPNAGDNGHDWEPASGFDGFDLADLADVTGSAEEPSGPARPGDLLVMVPVILVLGAVAMFFFSTMTGSVKLRNFALVLVPVSGVGFVASPLIVMLRARTRRR